MKSRQPLLDQQAIVAENPSRFFLHKHQQTPQLTGARIIRTRPAR